MYGLMYLSILSFVCKSELYLGFILSHNVNFGDGYLSGLSFAAENDYLYKTPAANYLVMLVGIISN